MLNKLKGYAISAVLYAYMRYICMVGIQKTRAWKRENGVTYLHYDGNTIFYDENKEFHTCDIEDHYMYQVGVVEPETKLNALCLRLGLDCDWQNDTVFVRSVGDDICICFDLNYPTKYPEVCF